MNCATRGAATAPYIRALADKGVAAALAEDAGFAGGLSIQAGQLIHAAVASSLGITQAA